MLYTVLIVTSAVSAAGATWWIFQLFETQMIVHAILTGIIILCVIWIIAGVYQTMLIRLELQQRKKLSNHVK